MIHCNRQFLTVVGRWLLCLIDVYDMRRIGNQSKGSSGVKSDCCLHVLICGDIVVFSIAVMLIQCTQYTEIVELIC